MPIHIYRDDATKSELAWLCDDEWNLPPQIEELSKWLTENRSKVQKGDYIADIGFCWRKDAGGGGSSLSPDAMKIMNELGIHLFLSEYPGFSDEHNTAEQGAAANP